MMKNIFVISFVSLLQLSVFSQSFEGKIFLFSDVAHDTTFFTYTVKGKYVRIDEFNKHKQLVKALIINNGDKKIIAINPAKKLYSNISTTKNTAYQDEAGFDVVKTTNFKVINGFSCNMWRVRNKDLNSEVTYWVAVDKFTFFDELVRTLKSSEEYYSFFLKLPETNGALPMVTEERTLRRDEKGSLIVLDVNECPVSESLFKVPSDYQYYETPY